MVVPVDGIAASQTLLGFGTCDPGYCLHYVWQAYKAHGAYSNASYPTAYSGWLASPYQHPDDWDPPAGVPVYLGPRAGSNAGDVMISVGGGMCAATDWPYNGVIGTVSISDRCRQTGRPYLGWTEDILLYPVLQGQPQPSPEPQPIDDGENMLILVANAEEPGQFAVWNEKQGWVDLDYGNEGNAELRGLSKMIQAASVDGQTQRTANLSSEEYGWTKSILTTGTTKTPPPGKGHD